MASTAPDSKPRRGININPQPTSIKPGQHTCPWWLLFTFDNPFRKLVHNPRTILSPHVNPGDVVLDVGCGMGYFTLELARLVGSQGKVIAADLQPQMLAGLRKRADRAGLTERITLQESTAEAIGVQTQVDFALAFWMVHEVGQPEAFLAQIYAHIKPGGKFLLVEPVIHVSEQSFERTITLAETVGFQSVDQPAVRFSRARVFKKE